MIKKWKRLTAGALCAFLMLQGTPQMVVAVQMGQSTRVQQEESTGEKDEGAVQESTGGKEEGTVQESTGQEEKIKNTETTGADEGTGTENVGSKENMETIGTSESTEAGTEPGKTPGNMETETSENTDTTGNTETSGDMGNTEISGDIENTETSGDVENTETSGNMETGTSENTDTAGNTETSGDMENTETSGNTGNTEEGTETSENTEAGGEAGISPEGEEAVIDTESTETAETTESVESTETTEDTEIKEITKKIKIVLNAPEGMAAQAYSIQGDEKTTLTLQNQQEIEVTITEEKAYTLDFFNLNGMRITSVTWENGTDITEKSEGDTLQFDKAEVKAIEEGSKLIIEAGYRVKIQLQCAEEDTEYVGLSGSAFVEEENPVNFTLQGITAEGIPLSLKDKEAFEINLKDLNGMQVEDIQIQREGELYEEIQEEEWEQAGNNIQFKESAVKKLSQGSYTLLLSVKILDAFIVKYQGNQFIDTDRTLLNAKYGRAYVETDEKSGKNYIIVEGRGNYFAKQVNSGNEAKAHTEIKEKRENNKIIGIENVKFSVPAGDWNFNSNRNVIIKMLTDDTEPGVTVIGGEEDENGTVVLYRKDTELFDIKIQAEDMESGIANVGFVDMEDTSYIILADLDSENIWKIEKINPRNVVKPAVVASDYYNHTTTLPVKIVVDNTPPELQEDTITPEGVKVTECPDTTYWQQSADTVALTFDIKEETLPVTAAYTIYHKTADGEIPLSSEPVTCTLEEVDKNVNIDHKRLPLDFAEACKNLDNGEQVQTLADLPDGKYVIKAKFNDATKMNETEEEAVLAEFELNTKTPILTPEDDGSQVHWLKNPTEPLTVKADIQTLNESKTLSYAVTYTTGADADLPGEGAVIPEPEDTAWLPVESDKIKPSDTGDGSRINGLEYELPVQEITSEGTVKFYLWIKDGLEHQICSGALVYNIDNTQPEYSNFKVTEKLNPAQRIYRYIFGTFLNGEETLEFQIDVKDLCPEGAVYASEEHQGDGSPAVTWVKLYYLDKEDAELADKDASEAYAWLEENKAEASEIEAVLEKENTYTTRIKVKEDSQFYRLYFAAEDKAGNISVANVAALEDGSGNYKISRLMVDKEKPVIEATLQEEASTPDYQSSEGKRWYAGSRNVAYDVTVKDNESGIFSVTAAVNGQKLSGDAAGNDFYDSSSFYEKNTTADMKLEKSFSYVVNLNQGKTGKDGVCTTAIETVDNAGNEESFSDTVYVDKDAPVITHMVFDTEQKDELTTVPMQYGYFFQKAVKATVYATDYIGNSKVTGSGVAKFVYQLNPADGKPQVTGELSPAVDENGVFSAEFTIPEGFKGQMEVKAIDNVGQDSGYYNPKGSVVETPEEHQKTSNARITLPQTNYKDSEGNPLYAADIQVKLLTADSRSGLKQSDWSVKSYYAAAPEASGSLQITSVFDENSRKWSSALSGDTDWSIPGALDLNLVTEAEKSISVGDDRNHIEAELEITDNAGNTSAAEKQIFSVDKIEPVVTVEYDNNSALNDSYYQQKRVATVTVTDANFSEKDCVFEIEGPEANISEWSHLSAGGCNGTVHTEQCRYQCQVEFFQDGDYRFGFRCTDLAGHGAAYEKVDEFTIDTEKPVINVTYDNNSAANGTFYSAGRRATIEIVDQNFNPAETNVEVTAALDGAVMAAPQASGFTQSGDTWSASVNFAEDGDYSLHVTSVDLAGNEAEEFAKEEFTVDTTAPEIKIEGVEDHSANKGTVAPTIRCEDINMDGGSFSIQLTGANRGKTAFESTRSVSGNSLSVSMADFSYRADMDDLYTLEVGVADEAGNETVESILFSVNRFGSVYILEDATKNLMDKFYTNKEQDIVITEVNVDTLQYAEIDYSLDGDTVTLQKGTDYTVTSKTDDVSWKMYEYRIKKENFTREGSYVVSVYSEDLAQNKSSNKAKGEELSFVVDKTAPSIVVAGVENHGQYVDARRNITVDAQDNLLLEQVEVYVGNEKREAAGQQELMDSNGQIHLSVLSANRPQQLYVVAKDAAGNEARTPNIQFLITRNLFVQWYSNLPLCVGSTTATVSAAGFVLFRKRFFFQKLLRKI